MHKSPSRKSETFLMAGHWHLYGFYFNREDPRIIVPKRWRSMGWTMNFARPMAIPLLLVIATLALAPFMALDYYEVEFGGAYLLAFLAVLVALVTFCSRMSDLSRFEKMLNDPE